MAKPSTLLLFIWLAMLVAVAAKAQANHADSAQFARVAVNMADDFNKLIGEQSRLYNGPQYQAAAYSDKTNANFKDTASFASGNVNYDGAYFKNIPLLYDVNLDLLVTRLYNNISIYSLLSEKVSGFDLLGHHFIRLSPDSLDGEMKPGFYDELYRYKLQVLAKFSKSIQEESASVGVGKLYVSSVNYFVKKSGKFYNVNSEGKFYDVLKDKKKELKQYSKTNKIKFGQDKAHALALLAAYYDHLTN